ncbi:MAG TPA: hypothetical protein VH482_25540 [Thermomicrobiales bacterium]|jgi:hypothetical protein
MNRRTFVTGSLGLVAALAGTRVSLAAQATPDAAASLPKLEVTLTDTGFDFPQPFQAGRYAVTVTNAGTSTASHSGLGKIPDRVTDAQYQAWLDSLQRTDGTDGQTDALTWDDIEFVGLPDWPQPGKPSTGVVDLAPGRYFLFDPFSSRGYVQLTIGGTFAATAEPAADLTVTLHEMAIDLPDTAVTTKPVRWKIENTGAISHEVAVIPLSPDFTEEDLKLLFTLPEDATPPPGTPDFVYQPIAAIGILAKGHTSWLDVQLPPGHYLAGCFLPFGTGYPHAMDGMYRFFDVK